MTNAKPALRYFRYLLLCLTLITSPGAFSQSATTETATGRTTQTLSGLSAEIAASVRQAEEQKAAAPDATAPATALELFNEAREQLQLREQFTSQTAEHEEAIREAPAMLERVKAELQRDDLATTIPDIPTTATADFVAQRLDERKAELKSLEQRQAEVEEEIRRRSTRATQIPVELTEARRQLTQAEIAATAVSAEEDPLVSRARQLLATAQIHAAQARINLLEKEQARYEARSELLPLASQLISSRLAQKNDTITTLIDALKTRRRTEATATAREIKQAARETGTSHSLVRAVAAENTSFTEELNLHRVIEQQEEMVERLDSVREEAQNIQQQYESLKEKFDQVGYSDALGILLRKQRNDLPNQRAHRSMLETLEQTLVEVNLKSLEIQDHLNELNDPAELAQEMVQPYAADLGTTEVQEIRRNITTLLQARKEYLTQIDETYEQYFQTLYSLNAAEEELVQNAELYAEFIDERILWLPSADPMSLSSISLAGQKALSILSFDTWQNYFSALAGKARIGFAALFGGVLLFLLLLFSRARWKKRLHDILSVATKNRLAAFRPVMRALLYSVLTVLPLPLLMVLVGLPLSGGYDEMAALASGLVRGGVVLFVLLLARSIIKRKGVAEVFFVWPEAALKKLRQTFTILLWTIVPASILVRASQVDGSDGSMEVARLVLAIVLALLAIVVARLLHPKTGVLVGLDVYRGSTWLYRLRYVTFFAIPAIFAGLSIAVLVGYIYTAIEVGQRLNVTFWVGAACLLVNEIIFFWILVKRRRLAIEEARRRREAAKVQDGEGEPGTPEQTAAIAEPAIDIAAISKQAGRLLHVGVLGIFMVGMWIVWADVLPALRYLDTQPLWSVSRQVTETIGEGTTQTVDKLVPVTLADLLLALFITFLSVVAIRNIPGLLDITVFQKFSVQPGERYAFNTLIRYVIILVGVIYIFSLMGLQWKQVQWLAAAVTVGLGFGLQEIFANFVSGLILLFERPVRVGDIVSVGDVTGKVSQIRIRATTIVNWDHKEHIIPNKELITGQVLNWTLSDRMVRLVINVHVAYGSDYDKAREILLKIAKDTPHILEDPAPAAAIDKMSPSSIDLILLTHLPNMDNMMDVKHSLISRIEREFTASGITIPYPTMDVRIERQP